MTAVLPDGMAPAPARPRRRSRKGLLPIIVMIVVLGGYLLGPILILLVSSFDTAPQLLVGPARWGLSNWSSAFSDPNVLPALGHTFEVWICVSAISFPVAIGISLLLARTDIRLSKALEFCFWLAFIVPPLASTYGWIDLLAPDWGFVNKAFQVIPGVEHGPFNVYSFWGIVFVRLMTDGIAYFVVLLTPAFRNMDGALEEASRVGGGSNLRTLLRVTVPMMIAPITLVGGLQLIKFFQGFEVEYLLGSQFHFFVYSTLIYQQAYVDPNPEYQNAIVLASVTLLIIAAIVPLQRWIISRRQYTTVSSSYRAGRMALGRCRGPATAGVVLLLVLLTVAPALVMVVGSLMTRVGFFSIHPAWTLQHWGNVFDDPSFWPAVRTTVTLALAAGIVSPLLFSLLAYVIVRTRWPGRGVLDGIVWAAAAMPGVLLGLGLLLLFLFTPGLKSLFGTIWPLVIVVLLAGVTTGTNVFKGVLVQLHSSLEEAGRVAGGGWLRTYVRVVLPVLRPSLVLVGMLSFVGTANMTSSIILLSSRGTTTLSILSLQLGAAGQVEEGSVISVIVMVLSIAVALPLRQLALRLGLGRVGSASAADPAGVAAAAAAAVEVDRARAIA